MLKPLAGALALALLAAPALAAAPTTPADVATAAVRISDLDLSNPSDAARLDKRVKVAAMSVCGAERFSATAVKRAVVQSDCYRDTLAQASTKAQLALASR
jgi:UrcA family protein